MFIFNPVRRAIRSAGPVTKATPTAKSKNAVKKTSTFFALPPRYLPTMSGMLLPSFRKDNIPEK